MADNEQSKEVPHAMDDGAKRSHPPPQQLEKIHVLPVGSDAPKKDLFRELKKCIKRQVVFQRHMPIYVLKAPQRKKCPKLLEKTRDSSYEKETDRGRHGSISVHEEGKLADTTRGSITSNQAGMEHPSPPPSSDARSLPLSCEPHGEVLSTSSTLDGNFTAEDSLNTPESREDYHTYVVVECVPSEGIITLDTLVFTEGLPLGPLQKVQFLALVTADSSYGREAGFTNSSSSYQLDSSPVPMRSSRIRRGPACNNHDSSSISSSCSSTAGVGRDVVETADEVYNSSDDKSATASSRLSGKRDGKQYSGRRNSLSNEEEGKSCEERLFQNYIAPYFRKSKGIVIYPGKKLVIDDVTFVIWSTEPSRLPGFVAPDTDIYVTVDPWGEYTRVHIVPFNDTLPSLYDYDLFSDYIRPYLHHCPWRLYRKGDNFSYGGVQFKLVASDPAYPSNPQGAARIGPQTIIHFEGSTAPSVLDVLPPDTLRHIRSLPARIQPFAIISAVNGLDPDVLMRVIPSRAGRDGIHSDALHQIRSQLVHPFELENYRKTHPELCEKRAQKIVEAEKNPSNSRISLQHLQREEEKKLSEGGCSEIERNMDAKQTGSTNSRHSMYSDFISAVETSRETDELDPPLCTVCTVELGDGSDCLIFPCGHVFHWPCVQGWLRNSHTCPNCRRDIRELVDIVAQQDAQSSEGENPGGRASSVSPARYTTQSNSGSQLVTSLFGEFWSL